MKESRYTIIAYPMCDRCQKRIWSTREISRCKQCGKQICEFCRKIFLSPSVEKVRIKGKWYTKKQLVYCKECGEQFECEYCEQIKTEEQWNTHLIELQSKLELKYLPSKIGWYNNCIYCGKFVCDLHSIQLDGIFGKYGQITVCLECLAKQKCRKCGNPISIKRWDSAKFNKKYELLCYDCNTKLGQKKTKVLRKNYQKHSNLQEILKSFFQKALGFQIRLERCLNEMYSVDFICVNPKTKMVYGMEIKTGKFSARITKQLDQYSAYFDYFYVLVKEEEADRLIHHIDKRVGIFLVNTAETRVSLIRVAQRSVLTKEKLIELMKAYALRWITIEYKFGITPYRLKIMPIKELQALVMKHIDDQIIREIYCEYVLGKKYNWHFAMTNQEYYQMYPQFKPATPRNLSLDTFLDRSTQKVKK